MSYVEVIGSKTGVAQELISMMPTEAFGKLFIDLFAGGAGVFFAKDPAKINILNDCDRDIVCMHEAIQRNHRVVEKELCVLLNDQDTFFRLRDLRGSEEWEAMPAAQRAAVMVFLYKASVNSNQIALSSASKNKSSFNPDLLLREYSVKLKRAELRSFHWEDCIDRYLYRSNPVEAFVLADPPYVVADSAKYYRVNFHPVDHIRFWHGMTRLSKGNGLRRNVKIMITYDDDPLIRALYRETDGWRLQPLDMQYRAAQDADTCRSEIVITNYEVSEVGGPHSTGDWSDVPHDRITVDGVPFDDLVCCEKETVALMVSGNRKGECRVCGKKVIAKEFC